MKKDLSPLLDQVPKTREIMKSLGKRSLKGPAPVNGKILHSTPDDDEDIEKELEKLNVNASNVDPNIFDVVPEVAVE